MDYFQILNLQREPFSNSPEPDFFFQADQHRGCLQKLELAVRLRRGLNVVIGEVGTGKTTLCRQLILGFSRRDEDREQIETHLILDPQFSDVREFLSAAALLLGLPGPSPEESEWQLKENIKNYLFTRGVDEGKVVVLIVDEGQKLPDFCLEILREFLNYETNEYKLLQIVIFAQKEFEQVLRKHENFADRVNQYYFLKPLNFRNSTEMIKFRITRAGSTPAAAPVLFTFPALWEIYRATGGYPRKIITLCHQVMLAMIIQNKSRAGFFLVRSCARRTSSPETVMWARWALALIGAGLLLLLVITNYGRMDFFTLSLEEAGKPVLPKAETHVVASPAEPVPVGGEINLQSPSLPAPLSAKESPPAASAKKIPDMLGQLTVQRNDYVLRILGRMYGENAIRQLESIARANPHIKNLNRVRKGDIIKIPARTKRTDIHVPQGKYWVQVARLDNLKAAYELLTESRNLPGLFLLPYWNEREGTGFAVLLHDGFDNETAALSAVKELPPPFTAGARVVKGWSEDTVFL